MSHPAWVCGLKLMNTIITLTAIYVTPCVGVWIETVTGKGTVIMERSHPAWVCGLKLHTGKIFHIISGHTLRGCVD